MIQDFVSHWFCTLTVPSPWEADAGGSRELTSLRLALNMTEKINENKNKKEAKGNKERKEKRGKMHN